MAGEQGGLLAFLNTPEGQGLLAGAFGGLAGARKGQPINSIGRAGMAGLAGYTGAQDQQQKLAQDAQRNKMFDLQMQQHQVALGQAQKAQEQAGMRQNYLGGVGQVTSPKVGAAPNQFDPMRWLGMGGSVDEAKTLANPNAFKPAPMTIKEGETLIDSVGYKPIFSNPKAAPLSDVGKLSAEMGALPDASPLRAIYQSALTKATTHAPGTSVSVNTGQKGLDNEFKLRDGFKAEPVYKAHQEMQSAYGQIQQSLKLASPAGDLAGATKIMKLLDPGSVVRESELGMAMAASGALDRLQYYAQNVVNGTKLTPTQRKDFQNLADKLYGESVNQFNTKRSEYEKLGSEYGLNPGRALGPDAAGVKPQAPTNVRRYNPATGKIE